MLSLRMGDSDDGTLGLSGAVSIGLDGMIGGGVFSGYQWSS